MSESPRLNFPYIVSSHILDALVQPVAEDVLLTTPPANPTVGELYVIGPSPVGVWTGKGNCLTQYLGDTWAFYVPFTGLTVWNKSTERQWCYSSSQWSETKAEQHHGRTDNPHATTAAQVGAMATTHAANAITGFASSGTATTVARGDHSHDAVYAATASTPSVSVAGFRITYGSTAPSNPVNGKELWLDTANKVFKIYEGSAWVKMGAAYSS